MLSVEGDPKTSFNDGAEESLMKDSKDTFFYDENTFKGLLEKAIGADKGADIFLIHITKKLKVPYGFVVKRNVEKEDEGTKTRVECFTENDSADTKADPTCPIDMEIGKQQVVKYGKTLYMEQGATDDDIKKKIEKFVNDAEEEEEGFAKPKERRKEGGFEEEIVFASHKEKLDSSIGENNLCVKCNSPAHSYFRLKHIYNHLFCGGNYDNPSSFNTWNPGFLKFNLFRKWKEVEVPPLPSEDLINEVLEVEQPNFSETEVNGLWYTWLAHATVLVRLHGVNIITDPVFGKRLSPNSFIGPSRVTELPCKVDELPKIDIVVISHDHYDHLEAETVRKIGENNPDAAWYVPLGIDKLLEKFGVRSENITPMTWGQSGKKTIFVEKDEKRDVTITCMPSQHWGCRGMKFSVASTIMRWSLGCSVHADAFERLWSSWAITINGETFFFTGDSGICKKEFIKIGLKFDNICLAAIGIGCYEPRWFMRSQHMSPIDAVKTFLYLKAKLGLPMHWGTYVTDATEQFLEPAKELEEALEKENIDKDKFPVVPTGRTVRVS